MSTVFCIALVNAVLTELTAYLMVQLSYGDPTCSDDTTGTQLIFYFTPTNSKFGGGFGILEI